MQASDAAASGNRVLAMSTLGRNGRFGNQVFQYAFLRIYAHRHGLEVRVPEWIGQQLFGHHDLPVGNLRLPMLHDQAQSTTLDRLTTPVLNVDVCGYFQYHTSWHRPDKAMFRKLFRPVPEIREPLEAGVMKLREGGRTLIGIHVRRGDFAGGLHFAAPTSWYTEWLAANWQRWQKPVLLLASDDLATVKQDFARFSPVTTDDLGLRVAQAAYYPDYHLLAACDALAISNSSFSFSAAMLNERATEFVRPVRAGRLLSFDPWDSEPGLSEGEGDEALAYYAQTYELIRRAAAAYRAGEPGADVELRRARRALADLWLGMNDDTLVILYNTTLAEGQRVLLSADLHAAGMDQEEHCFADRLREDLARAGLTGTWGTQYLLASMLYWPAAGLPIEHDLAAVPTWLLADYMAYLRS